MWVNRHVLARNRCRFDSIGRIGRIGWCPPLQSLLYLSFRAAPLDDVLGIAQRTYLYPSLPVCRRRHPPPAQLVLCCTARWLDDVFGIAQRNLQRNIFN